MGNCDICFKKNELSVIKRLEKFYLVEEYGFPLLLRPCLPVYTCCKIRYSVSILHLCYCPPINVLFYDLKYCIVEKIIGFRKTAALSSQPGVFFDLTSKN